VANCAGPFAATSGPMIDACLKSRTHYLDITGEIEVFLAAQSRHADAQSAGVVICPGVGFDVIPTDCIAAVLKEALPDATHLVLAFDAGGPMSPGTARTMAESLRLGRDARPDLPPGRRWVRSPPRGPGGRTPFRQWRSSRRDRWAATQQIWFVPVLYCLCGRGPCRG
jgi:short subunit dehydrogenase-like uncharacterized protein